MDIRTIAEDISNTDSYIRIKFVIIAKIRNQTNNK